VALRVAMTRGEFIGVGFGVGAKNWAGEQRAEWRGRYNVTLFSYCVVALRVAMKHGEFIGVGLGVRENRIAAAL